MESFFLQELYNAKEESGERGGLAEAPEWRCATRRDEVSQTDDVQGEHCTIELLGGGNQSRGRQSHCHGSFML